MNRNTIIKHNKFMNNQNYGQRSDGKTGLYIVIAIMAVLLIGGSIGATLFLFSKGVSEEELLANDQGFASITLGKRILRAETAAVALTSVVMFALGELK